jgi:uncharacterized protein YbjT (DUF2867 family)
MPIDLAEVKCSEWRGGIMHRQVITIFGGSGFIGRHLVRRFAKQGAEVRIAVRDIERAQFLKPLGDIGQVVPWQTNVMEPSQVATALAGADVAINLVGILYERGRRTFQALHVDAAAGIARAAADAGVWRLLHMSALGADAQSHSAYGRSKAAGEAAVSAAYPGATIFRPSVVFGPEDNFFNMFAGMMRFLPMLPVMGAPALPTVTLSGSGKGIDFFGDGGCKFQPVYVGDVAEAMLQVLGKAETAGKIYELGGPKVYSFKQIMELLLRVTERKRLLFPMPLGLAEFEALFLQLLPKPLLTPDQVRMMETDNVVSGKLPGLADLGISANAAEAVLPTYLHRFRTPSRQDAHAH